jgi:hypothetical protein
VILPADLRTFVEEERRTLAGTMPEWPHEHIDRDQVDEEHCERLVVQMCAYGQPGRFYGRVMTSYGSAGFVYRTVGAPLHETTIVNRCRSEDTAERRPACGTLPSSIGEGMGNPGTSAGV